MGTIVYRYKGPVMHFEKCVAQVDYFCRAKSKKHALNMLSGRYKQEHGYAMNTRYDLLEKYLTQTKGVMP